MSQGLLAVDVWHCTAYNVDVSIEVAQEIDLILGDQKSSIDGHNFIILGFAPLFSSSQNLFDQNVKA